MTPAEALEAIRKAGASGEFAISAHAYDRMRMRGATERDVRNALAKADTCERAEKPNRWSASGPDLDGDELTAIVAFDGFAVVVTVF